MRKQRPVFVLQNQQRGTALLCVEAWTENKDSSVPHRQRALFATNARVGLVFPVPAAKEKMAIFGNVKFAPIVQGDH